MRNAVRIDYYVAISYFEDLGDLFGWMYYLDPETDTWYQVMGLAHLKQLSDNYEYILA